jgi:3-methyladenine DNA glycosylase AlkD
MVNMKDILKLIRDEIFAYVMKHKDKMPRTALRYAIEKYPKEKRKEAMRK